jgi:hypothetical protein
MDPVHPKLDLLCVLASIYSSQGCFKAICKVFRGLYAIRVYTLFFLNYVLAMVCNTQNSWFFLTLSIVQYFKN